MPETVLILVRHGATRANTVRPYVLQGLRPDSELIDEGIAQAKAAARFLRSYPIVKAYCSPLKRAYATARLLADDLGVPLDVEEALVEVDVGQWAGLAWEAIEQGWPEAYRAFQEDAARNGYLGGENLAQVLDRVLSVIERLLARHTNDTILVVGHGVVNRVLLAHWLGVPLRLARRLPQENAAVNVVHFLGAAAQVHMIDSRTPRLPFSPEPLSGTPFS